MDIDNNSLDKEEKQAIRKINWHLVHLHLKKGDNYVIAS